jgi:colicin import membrane protein
MRFLGWLGSFLLHLIIFFLVFYSPSGSKRIRIDLARPVYEVELINLLPPAPAKQEIKKPVGQIKENDTKARGKEDETIPKQKKPLPEVTKIKAPRVAESAKPKIEDKKKISSKKIKKAQKATVEKKKEPSAQEILARALGSIKKHVREKQKSEKMILARELAGLRQQVKQSKSGMAQRRSGGSEGIKAIYARIAEEKIKENWRFPKIGTEENLMARVEVEIDEKGKIVHSRLVMPSGRRDFDLSVLKAVEETGELPPPPAKTIDKLIINFNLLELN